MKIEHFIALLFMSTQIKCDDCYLTKNMSDVIEEEKAPKIEFIDEAPGVKLGNGILIAYDNQTLAVYDKDFNYLSSLLINVIKGMKSMLVPD